MLERERGLMLERGGDVGERGECWREGGYVGEREDVREGGHVS